jgi:hypothetical protein
MMIMPRSHCLCVCVWCVCVCVLCVCLETFVYVCMCVWCVCAKSVTCGAVCARVVLHCGGGHQRSRCVWREGVCDSYCFVVCVCVWCVCAFDS